MEENYAGPPAGDPILELFNDIRGDKEFISAPRLGNFLRNRVDRMAAGEFHGNRAFNNNGWADRRAQFLQVYVAINFSLGRLANAGDLTAEQFVEFFRKLENGDFNRNADNPAGFPGVQWYQTPWGENAVDSLKELRYLAYRSRGPDAQNADAHLIGNAQPVPVIEQQGQMRPINIPARRRPRERQRRVIERQRRARERQRRARERQRRGRAEVNAQPERMAARQRIEELPLYEGGLRKNFRKKFTKNKKLKKISRKTKRKHFIKKFSKKNKKLNKRKKRKYKRKTRRKRRLHNM